MRKELILIVFLVIPFLVSAQLKAGIEGLLGSSIPTNGDFTKVFDAGLNLEIGMPLTYNNFGIKPQIGLLWYFKEIESTNSIKEHIQDWRIGVEIRYDIVHLGDLKLSPYVGVFNNSIRNYYSSTTYNPFDNTSETVESDNLFVGQSISWEFGSFFRIQSFTIGLGYEILKPKLEMDENIYNEAIGNGLILDRNPQFNFNSIQISIGYTYYFK